MTETTVIMTTHCDKKSKPRQAEVISCQGGHFSRDIAIAKQK